MGGLSCLSEQGQPFQGGLNFLSGLVWIQGCSDLPRPHLWAQLGSTVGLAGIKPCSWAGLRALCSTPQVMD